MGERLIKRGQRLAKIKKRSRRVDEEWERKSRIRREYRQIYCRTRKGDCEGRALKGL